MRPLRLTLSAFGPYAQPLTLDFANLQGHTFFLIHGPTGAGKSAILDAICYALYGKTSGAERDGDQMRSHYAGRQAKTEICLDFAVGEEQYRVRRCPEHERPKKHGEGTTTQPKEATLWRRSDTAGEVVLAERWEAVDTRVKKILGFDSAQFRQVAILPQGQFRQFLLASSVEREKILGVLFQTQSYKLIEEHLQQAAQRLERQSEQINTRLLAILGQADVATLAELEARVSQTGAHIQALSAQLDELREAEGVAQQQLEAGKRHHSLLAERDASARALAGLEAGRPAQQVRQREMQQAEQALALDGFMRGLEQRQQEAAQMRQRLEEARQAHAAAEAALVAAQTASSREEARAHQRATAQEDLAHLLHLVGQVQQLSAARTQLGIIEERLAGATTRAAATQGHLEVLQGRILQASAELDTATAAAGKLEAEGLRVQQLIRLHTDAVALSKHRQDHQKLLDALAQGRESIQTADAAYQSADDAAHHAQRRWEAGQAAILAQGLTEGLPCPVCGASHHPTPATGGHDVPSDAELQQLRRAARDAQAALTAALTNQRLHQDRQSRLALQIQNLEHQLGDSAHLQPATINAQLAAAKDAQAAAQQATDALGHLRAQAATLTQDVSAIERQHMQAREAVEAITLERSELLGQLRAHEAQIPAQYHDPATLTTAIASQQRAVDALNAALAQAEQALRSAAATQSRAAATHQERETATAQADAMLRSDTAEVTARLQAAGFPDEPAYQQARRSEADLTALRVALEQFEGQFSAASDRVTRAAAAAEGLIPPDLGALNAAAVAARTQLEATQQEQTEQRAQLATMERLLTAAQIEAAAQAELAEQYAVVKEVAQVASGENPLRITFHRYVLAALLDQVLIDASHRLQVMSSGRYTLHRSGTPLDRRRMSGLDLEVLDAYTGQARAIHTLSGGESFQAALALALGLADAAQANAGGIHLETLFVDEGFGSLDQQALELALQTLSDLQVGGRMVGIISHVAELQERIPARLEVSASPTGSTARFVLGNA